MGRLLWAPSAERVQNSHLYRFSAKLREQYGASFADYHELREWSVEHPELFWRAVWEYAEILRFAAA